MKPSVVILSLGAAVVGAGVVCWLNLSAAADARAAARRLSERNAILAREVRAGVDGHAARAAPSVHAGRQPAAATVAAEPARSVGAPRPVPPDASTLMAENPALRALFQRYTAAELGFRYRPFYHDAKLSPEMIARFQALILEQEQEDMDLGSAIAAAGVAKKDAARLRTDQQQQHDAQLRQLLGDDDYAKYKDFTRVLPMEAAVDSVATLGAETGEPLSEAQGERLLMVLARNSRSYQKGGRAEVGTLDLPQLLSQAEPLLSPHQFSVLRGLADLGRAFVLAAEYQKSQTKQPTAKP